MSTRHEFDRELVLAELHAQRISKQQAADAMGISRAALYSHLTQADYQRKPGAEELSKLAVLLSLPLGALLGIEEPRTVSYP